MLHVTNIEKFGGALFIGLFFGALYFSSLYWSVRLIGDKAFSKAIAIQCLRFGLLTGVFFILAKMGFSTLLLGAAGVLMARQIVLARVKKSP